MTPMLTGLASRDAAEMGAVYYERRRGAHRASDGGDSWGDYDDLLELLTPPEWHARAACRGLDPDLFFPERGASCLEAKSVCRDCPVQEECLSSALGEKFGIWGGRSERERRGMRRRQVPTKHAQELAAKVEELAGAGLGPVAIARTLGVTRGTVDRARMGAA